MDASGMSLSIQDQCASSTGSPDSALGGGRKAGPRQELTEEERREVSKLKRRDAEVKGHETAHMAAGGQYVNGGASYDYQTGPDGKKYAIGGEVSIDASPVSGNPQATIAKMQVVKRAALAPSQPSGQDQAVAAQASAAETKAQQELATKRGSAGVPASNGEKPVPGVKNEGMPMPPFPASATTAYTKNSFFSKLSPATAPQSAINFVA
jgi:hypothetical protein